MRTLIIDASVAAKWFLPPDSEPHATRAFDLLKQYADAKIRFVVPDLFWAEMGSIFWKAARQGRWSAADSEISLRRLYDRAFPTLASRTLIEDALKMALYHDRSIYDCIYVAAALLSKAELVTADERLANALAAHLPVKWLGSWS